MIFAMQRLRELKKADDDFSFSRKEKTISPGERLTTLLRDGPPVGVHVIGWCDTLSNAQRAFDRAAFKEWGLRVIFQMNPNDSSALIDSPAANKLGTTRALFTQEAMEAPEKFRPYGFPAVG